MATFSYSIFQAGADAELCRVLAWPDWHAVLAGEKMRACTHRHTRWYTEQVTGAKDVGYGLGTDP